MKRQMTLQSCFSPKEKVRKKNDDTTCSISISSGQVSSTKPTPETNEEIIEANSDIQWPEIWSKKQIEDFSTKYPWLSAKDGKLGCKTCRNTKTLSADKGERLSLSDEWMNCSINIPTSTDDKKDREKALSAIRGKIKKHNDSAAHGLAIKINERKQENILETAMKNAAKPYEERTKRVFRTVYYLAKMNRPFSDHDDLISLQERNGLDLGLILHSRYSATQIVNHIAKEMQKKIVKNLVENQAKLSIIIDESTSLSQKSVMTVHLKSYVTKIIPGTSDTEQTSIGAPEMIFLSLVELQNQRAEEITSSLLATLKSHGFLEEYLQENWISFVSDGASVLMGKSSGVAKRLLEIYPNLFIWHCLNHRLELAVNDAIDEVGAVNHFKIFLDCLYSLYHRSSKNKRQLQNISDELHLQCSKIGRILDVRWVSSSFRTIQALFTSFSALHRHFEMCSNDCSRDSRERHKFAGLMRKLASTQFVQDMGLMYDALNELSQLSLELQANSMTVLKSDRLIKRTIRVLQSFKTIPGQKMSETEKAALERNFQGTNLHSNPMKQHINQGQFLQSLVNNMQARLVDSTTKVGDNTQTVLQSLKVLEKETWPEEIEIRYGEEDIRKLSKILQVSY